MKKVIYCVLFLTTIVLSCLQATTHSEKTFLFSKLSKLSTENTIYNYYTHLFVDRDLPKKHRTDLWGSNFQITPFYYESTNKTAMGEYFGWNKNNVISIGEDSTSVSGIFDSGFLIHNPTDASDAKVSGKLTLKPHRKTCGTHLHYLQQVSKISNNLFFEAVMPVTHITHSMNPTVCDESKGKINETGEEKGILDYFSGNLSQTKTDRVQQALKYAKIMTQSRSKTGIEQLELAVRYALTPFDKDYYFVPRISLIVPMGNKPTGEFLFEPVLGNSKKWGVGMGVEGKTKLYDKNDLVIDCVSAIGLKVFLNNTQKRVIGLRMGDGNIVSWAQYNLVAKSGENEVLPAANILRQDVKVKQGLYMDGLVNFDVYYKKLLLNFGYHCSAFAGETVSVKNWDGELYTRTAESYDTTSDFDIDNDDHAQDKGIDSLMLEPSVAESPAFVAHKIYGLVSFVFSNNRVPVLIGVGGAYEFVKENSNLQGYEIYLKLGFSF